MALKVHRNLEIESLFDKFASLPDDKKQKEKDLKEQDELLNKKVKKLIKINRIVSLYINFTKK